MYPVLYSQVYSANRFHQSGSDLHQLYLSQSPLPVVAAKTALRRSDSSDTDGDCESRPIGSRLHIAWELDTIHCSWVVSFQYGFSAKNLSVVS